MNNNEIIEILEEKKKKNIRRNKFDLAISLCTLLSGAILILIKVPDFVELYTFILGISNVSMGTVCTSTCFYNIISDKRIFNEKIQALESDNGKSLSKKNFDNEKDKTIEDRRILQDKYIENNSCNFNNNNDINYNKSKSKIRTLKLK